MERQETVFDSSLLLKGKISGKVKVLTTKDTFLGYLNDFTLEEEDILRDSAVVVDKMVSGKRALYIRENVTGEVIISPLCCSLKVGRHYIDITNKVLYAVVLEN